MYKFINKKMSLSGNSARYSPTDLKRISPKFKRLNLVDFRDDNTVSVYHYGKIGMDEIKELKLLGKILFDPLIVVGYNYTDDRPIVVAISYDRVFFSDATIEIESTHHAITSKVKNLPYFKTRWDSHGYIRKTPGKRIPGLVGILEPECEFEFFDD